MKKALWLPLVVALAGSMTVTGCASLTRATDDTGQYVDGRDAHLGGQAALLGDSGLKSFEISVESSKDIVQLSGVVSTAQVKARASEVAAGVPASGTCRTISSWTRPAPHACRRRRGRSIMKPMQMLGMVAFAVGWPVGFRLPRIECPARSAVQYADRTVHRSNHVVLRRRRRRRTRRRALGPVSAGGASAGMRTDD